MSSIARLADTAPDWIGVSKQTAAKLIFKANPPSRSGAPGKQSFDLIAEIRNGELKVSEVAPGTDIPLLCVERHVNPGSTFCLFVDSEKLPQSHSEARNWWYGLKAYLQHQQYADKHGHWPIDAQMSHGPAAAVQREMEEVADELGWRADVLASIFRKRLWLGGPLARLAKGRNTLVNARSPCPRGCTKKHHPFRKLACQQADCLPTCRKQHLPILRVDCPNRNAVETLVRLEHDRRAIETRMVEQLKKDGHRCCGKMKQCALRNMSDCIVVSKYPVASRNKMTGGVSTCGGRSSIQQQINKGMRSGG